MRPPFPGMDPWLEQPGLWPDVHNSLIAAIRDTLAPRLAPRYFVGLEERTVLMAGDETPSDAVVDIGISTRRRDPEGRPPGAVAAVVEAVDAIDVAVPMEYEVGEWFLEVRQVETRRLVTVIEVLSYSNKRPGRDRRRYERRRQRLFGSRTSLVEIDLLRAGVPMPIVGGETPRDYRILISRSYERPRARLLAFGLRAAIPAVPIPLLRGDEEPDLDLNGVLRALYDRARYDLLLDYGRPPVPPLSEPDAAWSAEIVGRVRG